MRKKTFLLLWIAVFAFSMNSCGDGGEVEPDTEPEPEPPVYTDWINESSFTQSELEQIAYLLNLIPVSVITGFEEKCLIWIEVVSKNGFHSIPRPYSKLEGYDDMLAYCKKYGKAIYPVLFNYLVQRVSAEFSYDGCELWDYDCEFYIAGRSDKLHRNLYEDLHESGSKSFLDEYVGYLVTHDAVPVYALVDYSKRILKDEYDNILKSIQDISIPDDEVLETNTVLIDGSNIKTISRKISI